MFKLFSFTLLAVGMPALSDWAYAGLSERGAAYIIQHPDAALLVGPSLAAAFLTLFLQWRPDTTGIHFRAHAYKLPASIVQALAAAAIPYVWFYPPRLSSTARF